MPVLVGCIQAGAMSRKVRFELVDPCRTSYLAMKIMGGDSAMEAGSQRRLREQKPDS